MALDDALWDSVNGSREAAELRAYLRRFPKGRHLSAAQAQLAALSPSTLAAAVPAPSPSPSPTPRPAPVTATPPLAASPAVAVAPAAGPKPTERRPAKPPSNAQGYTVGDRWNYQVVDKYRGEVVRNYGIRVGSLESDGSWASGTARYDAMGRLVAWTNGAGEQRALLPHSGRWWPNMVPGEKRSFEYEDRWPTQVNQVKLESRVVGIESVRVPAGEFKAWRIHHKGTQGAIGRPGAREREELTSFTLVNHPGLN